MFWAIVGILFAVLIWITLRTDKAKRRIDRDQFLDDITYRPSRRQEYLQRTKNRKSEREDHIAFQDVCCWIFWFAVLALASKFF